MKVLETGYLKLTIVAMVHQVLRDLIFFQELNEEKKEKGRKENRPIFL